MSRVMGIAPVSCDCSVSEMVGMPLLTDGEMGDKGKFGFPYLMDNPAPLSSLLGLPVLSKRQ